MGADILDRGKSDCYQDRCENAPFSSVGGPDSRDNLKAPSYIKPEDVDDYLTGYTMSANEMYGDDWRTCEFGWRPVLTIEDGSGVSGFAGSGKW